jgi:hypothetical protein|tara:strand:+ start:322 stop:561 length:240 start_codon:yes stop_codon:yes gene_type:complete
MDSDYKRITNKLNNYKNSHPNFYNLWSQYLLSKRKNLMTDLTNCEDVIERLDSQADITNENLIALLILNNSYHLNTREQ